MKKFAAFLLTALIAFAVFIPTAFAKDFPTSKMKNDKAVLLIDAQSGEPLVEKSPDKKIYPASTTKLMTLLVCLEKGGLDDTATVGKEIDKFGSASSKMDLAKGEKLSRKDLIYGMMLISGNDAAATLAVSYGGSIEKFADMMNDKAKELGMDKTHFTCPEGVQDEDHYTTAADMAKLVQAGLKNQQWKDIVGTKEYDLPKTKLKAARTIFNSNLLINPEEDKKKYNYEYAEGGKTGSTKSAGSCLVSFAKKDGMELIALVFGDTTENGKWSLTTDLFDYGFENYKTVNLKDTLGSLTVPKQITNAAEDDENGGSMDFGPTLEDNLYSTLPAEDAAAVSGGAGSITPFAQFDSEEISAPIKKGDKYGTISYKIGDKVIYDGPLYALRDMAAANGQGAAAMASPGATATGAVKTQKPADLPAASQISPWWWMLLPVVLIAVIVIRVLTMNRKRRSKFRNKRRVYNYRIR